jgi:hypothetical protein
MMEKSIRTTIAMSEPSPLTYLAAVVALRGQIPGLVSAETQAKIQNLKGILDPKTLASARNGGDWRRGAAGAGAGTGAGGGGTYTYNGNKNNTNDSRHWNNQGQGQGRASGRAPVNTTVATSASTSAPVATTKQGTYTGPPMGRYVSRFKNHSEPLEEKILNRIILLKLNKFGPTTYTEIRDFLFQILGQESVSDEHGAAVTAEETQVAEFVRDFMLMVFKKAAAEQIYCPLYAKLLAEIGSKHSVIFDEMNSLYKNYMEIFEEADVNTVTTTGDMVAFEKKNVEKKYRQGYSQFIAELTTLEILPLDSLATTFKTLFSLIDKHSRIQERKPLVEEYVDCLLRMSRVLKEKNSEFFCGTRAKLMNENKELLDTLINLRDSTYPSLSPKSRFLLMDIQDILSKK